MHLVLIFRRSLLRIFLEQPTEMLRILKPQIISGNESLAIQISCKKIVEALQQIMIARFSGGKLMVVKPLAIFEDQLYIRDYYRIAVFIVVLSERSSELKQK